MSSSEQERLLQSDVCILVDENDKPTGSCTKFECHKWSAIEANVALHRAFSVFLFNKRNQLLLQKRSATKATFPGYWTNTCCSHPLANRDIESSGILGVKHAAIRRLSEELGLHSNEITLDDLTFMTRVLYRAQYDSTWGEHEIDYCLLAKSSVDTPTQYNRDEVSDVRYVGEEELRTMIDSSRRGELKLTPWFVLIAEKFLFDWWRQVISGDITEKHRIETSMSAQKIHSFDS